MGSLDCESGILHLVADAAAESPSLADHLVRQMALESPAVFAVTRTFLRDPCQAETVGCHLLQRTGGVQSPAALPRPQTWTGKPKIMDELGQN